MLWKDVWKDEVDGNDLTEFLPSYLKQYPRRPMVKLKEGDRIKTATVKRKKKEIWVEAEITSVDCSLAQVVFEDSRIQDVNMRKVCESVCSSFLSRPARPNHCHVLLLNHLFIHSHKLNNSWLMLISRLTI